MSGLFFLFMGSVFGVFIAGFFNGAEVALLSTDSFHLNKRRREGDSRATVAIQLLEKMDSLLATTQLSAIFFISIATSFAALAINRIDTEHHVLYFAFYSIFALLFADGIPKLLARYYSERVAIFVALPIYIVSRVLFPITALINTYTLHLSQFVGLNKADSLTKRKKNREELQAILSDLDNDNEIRYGNKRMIKKVMEFSHQNVKRAMIPLVNVDGISSDSSLQSAIDQFETQRHSRLPVFEDRVDNIIGILDFRDVFQCKDPEAESVTQYMKSALFVPEVQQLQALARELNEVPCAIVVDEYGGAVGLITREDILEEIVGDISDEWDEHALGIQEISSRVFLVPASTSVSELNEKLGASLPTGEYETISGFLLQQFNKIPSTGDELYFGSLKIKVHRATNRAIKTIIVEILSEL